MARFRVPALLLCVTSAAAAQVVLPAGTQLPVRLPDHVPMRVGTPVRAELIYPVYVDNELTLPAHLAVLGSVVGLKPNHRQRVKSRLQADFTPFWTPVVQFTAIVLADGRTVPVVTGPATDGAPTYRVVAEPKSGGLIARGIHSAKQAVSDQVHVLTDPGKGDRLTQLFYSQLPYHPQRIAKDTAWTAETTAPVTLPADAKGDAVIAVANAIAPRGPAPGSLALTPPPPSSRTEPSATWMLQAYLTTPVSSAASHQGDSIQALVAEPILAADGSIAVPQGSIMTGTVTDARPARRLGRAGVLHFAFNKLTMPGQETVSVQSSIRGADLAGPLTMDAEGNVKPKPRDRILQPLLLVFLAQRPLDRDGGRHMFGKDLVGSNSLGFIGFIVGTAARQANLAAAIGYYGAAISIYDRILGRGKEIEFPRDTRVTVETTARKSSPMRPGL